MGKEAPQLLLIAEMKLRHVTKLIESGPLKMPVPIRAEFVGTEISDFGRFCRDWHRHPSFFGICRD
jgi:hypothetical protein